MGAVYYVVNENDEYLTINCEWNGDMHKARLFWSDGLAQLAADALPGNLSVEEFPL